MIGLYVHLCCLVERLVTKTPIDNYQDLEEFEQKHADFIRQVRDSFQDISRHYRVTILPLALRNCRRAFSSVNGLPVISPSRTHTWSEPIIK